MNIKFCTKVFFLQPNYFWMAWQYLTNARLKIFYVLFPFRSLSVIVLMTDGQWNNWRINWQTHFSLPIFPSLFLTFSLSLSLSLSHSLSLSLSLSLSVSSILSKSPKRLTVQHRGEYLHFHHPYVTTEMSGTYVCRLGKRLTFELKVEGKCIYHFDTSVFLCMCDVTSTNEYWSGSGTLTLGQAPSPRAKD